MTKKTRLTLFIFVLLAGTAHVNLTASEEQEKKDGTEICEKTRKRFQRAFQTNQQADSAEKSKSAQKKELTIRRAIAKYNLYDEKRLRDPNLRHLHPSKRLIIPYKPGLDGRYP